MSSKTKIVVLRMKEIIYTAIFLLFAVLLIILLLFMFRSEKTESEVSAAPASSRFTPGTYSSSIVLGSHQVNVEVTVDSSEITSVSMVPLTESVEVMYPLMQPAMDSLSSQILSRQSLEGLEYPAGSQYTASILVHAVEAALSKAKP